MKSLQLFFFTSCFLFFSKNLFAQLTPVWSNKMSAYIDVTGKEISPFKYSTASFFTDSLGLISKADEYYTLSYGYINHLGEEVIPLVYDDAQLFHEGFALVMKDKENFIIDKMNNKYNIDNLHFDWLNIVSDGLVIIQKDQKFGYSNLKNELIFPTEFDFAFSFSEGYAVAIKNQKIVILEKSGKQTRTNFSSSAHHFVNALLPVQDSQTQKWGVINTKLDTIVKFEYSFISEFCNGFASFEKEGEQGQGLMNEKGEEVMDSRHYKIYSFSEGRLLAESGYGNTLLLFDENFKEIAQYENTSLTFPPKFTNGLCLIGLFNKNGEKNDFYDVYINREGKIIWT
ncbi:MAG: WG repeat-containing protein, partial [Bacteroidota bacterium]